MASLQRIRVAWSGAGIVGPGVTTFFGDPAVGPLQPAAFKTFFDSIKTKFPPGITWTIPDGGDTIDELSGKLVSAWSTGGGGAVNSAGNTQYAQGVGARIVWDANGIYRNRRVKGSTFLVPLANSEYSSQGLVSATTVTAINTAAATLITSHAGALAIWNRKSPKGPGAHFPIVKGTVPPSVSWLRSRRV